MNISDYLSELQELTRQNLNILEALNASFYTKNGHLGVEIAGQHLAIPSFLQLESKINTLQSNFENLVNAPKTGTAAFVFDGNTQEIQMKGFSNVPAAVSLDTQNTFQIDYNDVLKDFVTPNPYIRFNMPDLPNDITKACVLKMCIKTRELRNIIFEGMVSASKVVSYKDIKEILEGYKEDVDYVSYETIRDLPTHKGVGYGKYTIESVVEDKLDDNFVETYVIKLGQPLTYTIDGGTITKYIQLGDTLVTLDDKTEMKITDINYATNSITVEITNGAYVGLTSINDIDADSSYLKYKDSIDFDADKYIDVTLEEDDNIVIFIAPINSLNIQAPYIQGIAIDCNYLTCNIEGTTWKYLDYYKSYVNNIGDTLFGLTSMINNTINNLSKDRFETITSLVPQPEHIVTKVINANAHLNNSKALQDIRTLYSQKKQSESDLQTVQLQIDDINQKLQTSSFQNMSQNRTVYEQQLNALKAQRTSINENIKSIVNELSNAANNANIPISGMEYAVAGYFDYNTFLIDNEITDFAKIVKIRVQYRYKNIDKTVSDAVAINEQYLYSDWHEQRCDGLIKAPSYGSNSYIFDYNEPDQTANEIKFNQISVPIRQGESVDIRVKAIYDYGYPFIECASEWSNPINVTFPDEFKEDVQILDIISENNDEVKKNQLNDILEKNGVIKHVDDFLQDQDVLFFHKPDSIASGFWTAERRVIPLSDKLKELDSVVHTINDEVFGVNSDQLSVSILCDNTQKQIQPFAENKFFIAANDDMTTKVLTLQLANTTSHNLKIFSIFPGAKDGDLMDNTPGSQPATEYMAYSNDPEYGEGYAPIKWLKNISSVSDPDNTDIKNQKLNQLIYIRRNRIIYGNNTVNPDIFLQVAAFGSGEGYGTPDKISNGIDEEYGTNEVLLGEGNYGMALFGAYNDLASITTPVSADMMHSYVLLKPGEAVNISFVCQYKFENNVKEYHKTISFDVKTSLYKEPTNYEFTVYASKYIDDNIQNQFINDANRYQPVIIN